MPGGGSGIRPVLSSTPLGVVLRKASSVPFPDTPHVALAGVGLRRKNASEQRNSDEDNVSVASVSSRRSIRKHESKPRRNSGNVAGASDWMYYNTALNRNQSNPTTDLDYSVQKDSQKQNELIRAESTQVVRKQRQRRGIVALKEIRAYQKSTRLLLRKLPFARVVRSLAVSACGPRVLRYRWQAVCILALQEAAEALIVHLFESAQRCAIHAKRVTVMPKDIHLVTQLQNIPTTSQNVIRSTFRRL